MLRTVTFLASDCGRLRALKMEASPMMLNRA